MDPSTDQFLALIGLLLVLFSIWTYAKRRERQKEARRRLERVHVASPDPRFALDHATAVVAMQRESGRADGGRGWESFRVLRNPHGEYFVHWCSESATGNDNGSYVEHLTRERALHALRGDPAAFEREFGRGTPWMRGRARLGQRRPER